MMTSAQFERERDYCAAILLAKRLLKQGIITKKDFDAIHKILTRKYQPVIALL